MVTRKKVVETKKEQFTDPLYVSLDVEEGIHQVIDKDLEEKRSWSYYEEGEVVAEYKLVRLHRITKTKVLRTVEVDITKLEPVVK